jgi:hypothetical protein
MIQIHTRPDLKYLHLLNAVYVVSWNKKERVITVYISDSSCENRLQYLTN